MVSPRCAQAACPDKSGKPVLGLWTDFVLASRGMRAGDYYSTGAAGRVRPMPISAAIDFGYSGKKAMNQEAKTKLMKDLERVLHRHNVAGVLVFADTSKGGTPHCIMRTYDGAGKFVSHTDALDLLQNTLGAISEQVAFELKLQTEHASEVRRRCEKELILLE